MARAALGSARRRRRIRSHATPLDEPEMCLAVVHLDVAALDVAAPGVDAVGAAESSMENRSPVKCRPRAARLTLVEHQDGESARAR